MKPSTFTIMLLLCLKKLFVPETIEKVMFFVA